MSSHLVLLVAKAASLGPQPKFFGRQTVSVVAQAGDCHRCH